MRKSVFRLGIAVLGIVLMTGAPSAFANSCQQSCRAQWNQCRIATKGSSSCDAQLQACMQACIPRR
jgi:hypothetical protein